MRKLRDILARRRKPDLREQCRQAYGDAFVEEYDKLERGETIGGLFYTIDFLDKIEAVRKGEANA